MFSWTVSVLSLVAVVVVNAKIYTNPPEWNGVKFHYGTNNYPTPDLSVPQNSSKQSAQDIIDEIKEIGDIFRSYDKTTIKKEVCLKFETIDYDTDTFKLYGVEAGHERDIVEAYLSDVCENLNTDLDDKKQIDSVEKCKKQMATVPYISDGFWDYDHVAFDSINTTYPSHIRIWKTKDENDMTNWLIFIARDTVKIAPDTLIITNSHCDFFHCSESVSIEQIPHDLSGTDVEILTAFFNSILIRHELSALNMTDQVNMTELVWPKDYC